MPAVNAKLIEGVFSDAQKLEMIERLTDAMVEIEGEARSPRQVGDSQRWRPPQFPPNRYLGDRRRFDVQELRNAGFDDVQIFAMTVITALRLAFSTINGALGANPDDGPRSLVPLAVLNSVTFGRPIDDPDRYRALQPPSY